MKKYEDLLTDVRVEFNQRRAQKERELSRDLRRINRSLWDQRWLNTMLCMAAAIVITSLSILVLWRYWPS